MNVFSGCPFQAARIIVDAQASDATISCSAHGARIVRWKATNSTKMSIRELWFGCLCIAVARFVRFFVCHPFVFQQLQETFSIFCSNEITIFAFEFTSTSIRLVRQCFIEFWYFFGHHQISVRIIMEIVLFQCIQRFANTTNAWRLVEYTLFVSIFYTNRFTGCHFFRICAVSDSFVYNLEYSTNYVLMISVKVSIVCFWCGWWGCEMGASN